MKIAYSNKINEIVESVLSTTKDIILIGDNSSGKSDILREILLKDSEIYYIDSYNRTFNYQNALLDVTNASSSTNEILQERLKEYNFNLKDSFGSLMIIDKFYSKYKTELSEMLKLFLNIDLTIINNETEYSQENKIIIDGNEYDKLSSGYQAIIRIFLEILWALDNSNLKTIVIDEINEFLSAKNEAKIMLYLKETFPELRFIITTHSADVIASINTAELIILKEDNYEILDSSDYEDVTDVRMIFNKLYFSNQKDKEENDLNSLLRKLYSKRIQNQWDENSERELKDIDINLLSNTQKMLLKSIEEWL